LALCWVIGFSSAYLHREAHAQTLGDSPAAIDQKIPNGHGQQAAGTYRAYTLRHGEAREVEPLLRKMLGEWQGTVQVVVDSRSNQILVQGPPEAQQVAAELIRSVDKKPVTAGPSVSQTEPRARRLLVTYPVTSGLARELTSQLLVRYANRPQVRIAADPRRDLLFVFATRGIQREIRDFLKKSEKGPPVEREAMATTADPLPTTTSSLRPATQIPAQPVWLTRTGAARVARELHALLAASLREIPGPAKKSPSYVWHGGVEGRITIHFDTDRQTATVIGPGPEARQMIRLLNALDQVASATESLKVLRVRARPRR